MAAPVYSSQAINHIGNGLGYIFITKPIASSGSPLTSEIVKVLDNDADGVRQAKTYGLQAAALAANRVSTGIYVIDAPTGAGSVTAITDVFGGNMIDTASPIAYTGATTAATLASDIADAINNYSPGSPDDDFTAIADNGTVYIFGSPLSTKRDGSVTITSTGSLTYSETQAVSGGSQNDYSFDDSIGYQFFLDADYSSGGCCPGEGTATITDISKAVEVTNYFVFIGLNAAIPTIQKTISGGILEYDRQGSLTHIRVKGEGAANDDLDALYVKNPSVGDRVILTSASDTITINSGVTNITLNTSTYNVITPDMIELMYWTDNNWYEVSRSSQVIGSTSDYRTAGFGIFANESYQTAAVGSGGTVNYTPNTDEKYQKLTGSSSLGSNQIYGTTGTPIDGDEFWLEYDAAVTVGAFTITIFGITLTADQALNGGLVFYTRYLGGAWYTHVFPNLNDGNTYTFQAATELYKDASVTAVKVEDTLKTEVLSRQISFESNEVGDMKMYMGYPGTVEYFWFTVDKDLAATDNGTIVPKNNAGTAMTSGTVTATASSTIGTSFTATPTANNTFVSGDVLTFTTNKTTKGGKGTLYVKVTKS